MSKKTGVITFHFCLNYGAILQNYALIHYLRNNGVEAFTLNAVSVRQEENNSLYHAKSGLQRIVRNIVLFPLHIKRKEKQELFASFISKELYLTNRVENSIQLERQIDEDNFEVIISGSDQVWNPHNPDFEEAFLFPFCSRANKYGYAVSLGEATGDDLKAYSNYISDFTQVGVREKGSIETIKQFNSNVIENVDPVLLLDKKQWKELSNRSILKIRKPYIVCYYINKAGYSDYYDYAKRLAKEMQLPLYIINSNYSLRSYSRNALINIGPVEFLDAISNATFVCTDSFHGTVFSTIMNVPFISFIKSSTTNDSRVKDFLCSVDLGERIIYRDLMKKEKYMMPTGTIDFEKTEQYLRNISFESKRYIDGITK